MTTWTTIFPDVDGSPVRGEPSEFRTTARFFSTLAEQTRSIVDEFARFADDGQASGSLEGETGKAFGDFIEEVDSSLSELPEVSGNAADIFEQHVEELSRLREWAETGADSALARARTAWDLKTDLEADAVQLRRSHDAIMRQIDQVDASDDGTGASDPERSNLDDARGRNADSLRQTEQGIGEQERILAGIRSEWSDIRAAERRLDDKTVSELDDIRLGDLEDPGFWDKIVSGAFDLMITLGTIAIGSDVSVGRAVPDVRRRLGGDVVGPQGDPRRRDRGRGCGRPVLPTDRSVRDRHRGRVAVGPRGDGDAVHHAGTEPADRRDGRARRRAVECGWRRVQRRQFAQGFARRTWRRHIHADVRDHLDAHQCHELAFRAQERRERDWGGSRPRDPHDAAGSRHGLGRAWRYVAQSQVGRWRLPARRTPSAVTSGAPARCWACPTAPRLPSASTRSRDRTRTCSPASPSASGFNQPWHWNNGILPGGHELHIVPAN